MGQREGGVRSVDPVGVCRKTSGIAAALFLESADLGSGRESAGWSKPAAWSMGLLKPEDWNAKWITIPDPKRLSHPWLRRTFEVKEDVERAVIYINTASYYELHINGKKVGPYVLEPGITQVNKRFIVNAYDVTSFLVKGTNTIAVWMGPGWYQPSNGNNFNAPILRAQLSIVTPSGPMDDRD